MYVWVDLGVVYNNVLEFTLGLVCRHLSHLSTGVKRIAQLADNSR